MPEVRCEGCGHERERTLLHRLDLIRLCIRNLNGELLLELQYTSCDTVSEETDLLHSHNNLHCVQAVQTEVLRERSCLGQL